jgi:hypothetical protein
MHNCRKVPHTRPTHCFGGLFNSPREKRNEDRRGIADDCASGQRGSTGWLTTQSIDNQSPRQFP